MKKIYLFILVVIFSLLLILSTFSARQKNKEDFENMQKISNFLNTSSGIMVYSNNSFIDSKEEGELNYRILNPIDGIYYNSNKKNPISIKKTDTKTIINIDEWIYVFVLNDIFEKYEIKGSSFKLSQLGKWIFFINNNPDKYKFYSYNSMLSLDLIEWNEIITNLKLFPSFMMDYDPRYNSQIKNADILRVLVINPLYYIDAKWTDFLVRLSDEKKEQDYVSVINKNITNRYNNFKDLYKTLLKMNVDNIKWSDYIEKYSYLFTNQNKRNSYYVNIAVTNFLDILKNFNSIENFNTKSKFDLSVATANIVDSLNKINSEKVLYEQALSMVKNYYYLSYFGTKSDVNDDFNKVMKEIFSSKLLGGEYFSELSNIYFAYYFEHEERDNASIDSKLDDSLSKYLKDIQNRKILKDEDYLNFSFFIMQYIKFNFNNSNIDDDILSKYINTMPNAISYFNNYYKVLKKDEKSWALSIQFYYLWQIFDTLNNKILKKYFEKTEGGYIDLKSVFINKNDWSLNTNTVRLDVFLSTLDKHKNIINKDLLDKKIDFYSDNLNSSNSNQDSYKNLENKYIIFENILNRVISYDSNKFKSNLDSENITSESIIKDNKIQLSKSNLEKYLSNFNWLNIGSLNINNIRTLMIDNYYDVQIWTIETEYVWYKEIIFRLDPNNKNTISKIVIYKNDGSVNNNFSNISIPLDDKEEFYKNSSDSEDPNYGNVRKFADFFKIAFNESLPQNNVNNNQITNVPINDKPKESKEVVLFKQKNLIEWDFTFIKDFFNIPFYSIKVGIAWWKYDITLENIPKQFNGNRWSYMVELTTKYDFTGKYFYNTAIKVINWNSFDDKNKSYYFNNTSLWIKDNINLKTFSEELKNLWFYIDIVEDKFTSSISEVKFDLSWKRVLLDNNSFNVLTK